MNRTKLLGLLLACSTVTGLMVAAEEPEIKTEAQESATAAPVEESAPRYIATRPSVPLLQLPVKTEEKGPLSTRTIGELSPSEMERLSSREEYAEGILKVYNGNYSKPVWFSWKDAAGEHGWEKLGMMNKPTYIRFKNDIAINFSVKNPETEGFDLDGFAGKMYVFDAELTPQVNISATAISGKNPATGKVGWFVRIGLPKGTMTTREDLENAFIEASELRMPSPRPAPMSPVPTAPMITEAPVQEEQPSQQIPLEAIESNLKIYALELVQELANWNDREKVWTAEDYDRASVALNKIIAIGENLQLLGIDLKAGQFFEGVNDERFQIQAGDTNGLVELILKAGKYLENQMIAKRDQIAAAKERE